MSLNHPVAEAVVNQDYLFNKLKEEHDSLDMRIEDMRTQPSSDSLQLVMLKKRKLAIADKMERIQHN